MGLHFGSLRSTKIGGGALRGLGVGPARPAGGLLDVGGFPKYGGGVLASASCGIKFAGREGGRGFVWERRGNEHDGCIFLVTHG